MEDVTPIQLAAWTSARTGKTTQVWFHRAELHALLNCYCRGVAAGLWRDYSIDELGDRISFSIYRRAAETPEFRIYKVPALTAKQGAYILMGVEGQVLKRGHDLNALLAPLERKLIKLVE